MWNKILIPYLSRSSSAGVGDAHRDHRLALAFRMSDFPVDPFVVVAIVPDERYDQNRCHEIAKSHGRPKPAECQGEHADA